MNTDGDPFFMADTGSSTDIKIPCVMIGQDDGVAIKQGLQEGTHAAITPKVLHTHPIMSSPAK
jgi:hypothetical protein